MINTPTRHSRGTPRAHNRHERRPVWLHAGRPQSNGCVERVQRTILEECWRPTFARALVPKLTALARDLRSYLAYYNHERANTGRFAKNRVPAEIVFGAHKMHRP